MEKISTFFKQLGFPLRNIRQSWGARSDKGVLLTTWDDDLGQGGRYVCVFDRKARTHHSSGLSERIDHLRTMWSGGLAGYAIVAKAKDPKAVSRQIASFDTAHVRAIVSLVSHADGSVWAELGDNVPVQKLKKHAVGHRLIPAEGPFPAARAPSKKFKDSSAAYIAKLPEMREWLISVARRRGTVSYAEARAPFGLRSLEHQNAMDRIGHQCVDFGEPILTSLIVDEVTRRCSEGFTREFRRDDAQEREDCYAFWAPLDGTTDAPERGNKATHQSISERGPDETLQARAARFAQTAVRPDQAAFRRRVFLEHRGACVVTGCTIPEALDAAHREGRDWRLGHNSGADGLLLRKDVHALYDAGLVRIDVTGTVTFDPRAAAHYRMYERRR